VKTRRLERDRLPSCVAGGLHARWRHQVRSAAAAAGVSGLAAVACSGAPSPFDPAGPRAARIAELGWVVIGIAAVIFVVVVSLLAVGLFHRRLTAVVVGNYAPRGAPEGAAERERRESTPDVPDVPAGNGSGTRWVVAGGIIVPAIVLAVTLGLTVRALGAIAPGRTADLEVEVVGYQFWWEVRYPGHGFVTANEIHIPTGRSVALTLTSQDVIHSFWVPQLQGKLDLIPGKSNTLWLQADSPGVYRGQCAEFCGIQHAQMALLVVAEPPAAFEAWAAAHRAPARQPADSLVQRGAQVFAREGCITCHSVRHGEQRIGGQVGPDLTHLASRRTIAAGALPNTRGNLAGWILNPQAIKPGSKMPPVPMDGESLQSLLAYLESLE
jgi:cytochrome c oxidase subunit 2